MDDRERLLTLAVNVLREATARYFFDLHHDDHPEDFILKQTARVLLERTQDVPRVDVLRLDGAHLRALESGDPLPTERREDPETSVWERLTAAVAHLADAEGLMAERRFEAALDEVREALYLLEDGPPEGAVALAWRDARTRAVVLYRVAEELYLSEPAR